MCNANVQEAASRAIDKDPELREMLNDIGGIFFDLPIWLLSEFECLTGDMAGASIHRRRGGGGSHRN